MEGLGLSPVELSDSSADLFSDAALRFNTFSATTNYECNSNGSADAKRRHTVVRLPNWSKLDSKRQSTTKPNAKTHKFRFWLNKKNCKGPSKNKKSLHLEGFDKKLRDDDIAWDFTTNSQTSLYNHQISLGFFSNGDFSEVEQSFSSQATICELDNEVTETIDVFDHFAGVNQSFSSQAGVYEFNNEIGEADIVIVSDATEEDNAISISEVSTYDFERRENEGLEKEDRNHLNTGVLPNIGKCPLYNEIADAESEYFQDVVSFSEENSNALDILQQSTIPNIRARDSAGTFLESFSDPWLDSNCPYVSWNEQEIRTGQASNFHSSFSKRRTRLRFLVHYLRNKLSRNRIDSEIRLMDGLWHSILMREKNAYWHYYYH